jgi:hypothetical protein
MRPAYHTADASHDPPDSTRTQVRPEVPFDLVAFCYNLFAAYIPKAQETRLPWTFLARDNVRVVVEMRPAYHTADAISCHRWQRGLQRDRSKRTRVRPIVPFDLVALCYRHAVHAGC